MSLERKVAPKWCEVKSTKVRWIVRGKHLAGETNQHRQVNKAALSFYFLSKSFILLGFGDRVILIITSNVWFTLPGHKSLSHHLTRIRWLISLSNLSSNLHFPLLLWHCIVNTCSLTCPLHLSVNSLSTRNVSNAVIPRMWFWHQQQQHCLGNYQKSKFLGSTPVLLNQKF